MVDVASGGVDVDARDLEIQIALLKNSGYDPSRGAVCGQSHEAMVKTKEEERK